MAQSNTARADNDEVPTPTAGNRPVEKIRLGNITGNIWRNSGQNGDFYTASFERSYSDQGQVKSTDSFRPADLPVLNKVSDTVLDKLMELEKGRGR